MEKEDEEETGKEGKGEEKGMGGKGGECGGVLFE